MWVGWLQLRLNKLGLCETQLSVGRKGVGLDQLELLYRARFEHFARVASAITGDGESGRDAVQSAFASAVRQRASFRGIGPVEAWLWRIVVNEARGLRPGRVLGSSQELPEPSSNGHAGFDDLGLRALLASLPDRQRAAIFLRYYADLDYRTIADVLEIEVGTVSASLSAAHTTLRKALRKETT
jgi:RNA polymerase sigma-70 factor, ECF subfamily